jgi:hypothetical protein
MICVWKFATADRSCRSQLLRRQDILSKNHEKKYLLKILLQLLICIACIAVVYSHSPPGGGGGEGERIENWHRHNFEN